MKKKYIVRLSDDERKALYEVIAKLKGSSRKVRRAQMLLKADADGPGWKDADIADAFDCSSRAVESLRERFVIDGFELTLNGQPHARRPKLLTGKQEAKIIAERLKSPPAGFAHWSLRLVADRVVELEIVDSISHETIRATLKKTNSRSGKRSTG